VSSDRPASARFSFYLLQRRCRSVHGIDPLEDYSQHELANDALVPDALGGFQDQQKRRRRRLASARRFLLRCRMSGGSASFNRQITMRAEGALRKAF